MKKRISLLSTFLLLFSSIALAQVSGFGLGTTQTDGGWSPEDSGHYVHKKSKKVRKPANDDDDEDSDDDAPHGTSQEAPPVKPVAPAAPAAPVGQRLAPEVTPAVAASPQSAPSTSGAKAAVAEPENFSTKVRDFVLGGDSELIQNYKNFLDRQDIRKNFFEFTLATGFFYNLSSSPFYTRNYNDAAPTVDLGADIWFTPFFGVDAEYRASLMNELTDSPTGPATVNITQSWLNLGFKFRRFFGMTANSTVLTTGVRYSDFSLSVPTISQSRVSLDTQGVEFDFDLSIPVGKKAAFNGGFMLEPIAAQNERTGANITSGSSNQTMGAGGNLGLSYRVTRQLVGFMKLSSFIYKTEFSGSSSKPDPVAGVSLSNVPVTNVFYLFELGLKLGN